MGDLSFLESGDSWSAPTDDPRTPERFLKLATGQKVELQGNSGSILVISGSARIHFADGSFSILGRRDDVFHCRTTQDHILTATEDAVIKILGKHVEKPFQGESKPMVQLGVPRMVKTSDEALYALAGSYAIGEREMQMLREEVVKAPRHRIRICTHKSANELLHEMFVCYTRETAIAPHKHLSKDESFHLLDGELDFIMFNQTGDVKEIIPMGIKGSGKPFYVRVPRDTYHTVAMTSDYCILHEGTAGPFDRAHTVQMGITRST